MAGLESDPSLIQVLAFTLAGLNVMLARSHRRMVAAEKKLASVPKRRKKRRADTFDEVLGPTTDSTHAVDETGTFNQGADAFEEARSVEEPHAVEDSDTADRAPP